MECLTPTVSFDLSMDNYFTSFRLFVCLPTLELTTFEQEVCSTKIGYANTLSSGTNSCKKRNVTTLKSAAHIKQKCCVACVAGKNDKRALYIPSSESCCPNKNLFGVGTKLVSNETMVVVPVCFNDRCCSSGCVGIVLN